MTDCTRTLAEYNNGLARPGCPGSRFGFARALISNLRMDPCEPGLDQGVGAVDLMARHIWLLVPVQQKIREFLRTTTRSRIRKGIRSVPAASATG